MWVSTDSQISRLEHQGHHQNDYISACPLPPLTPLHNIGHNLGLPVPLCR